MATKWAAISRKCWKAEMTGHQYTTEQLAYLRRHAVVERRYLAMAFNNHFGTALSESAIKQTCHRLGIKTGRTGRFEPGNLPYNTGTKGLKTGSCTSFKAGHMPHNHQPVGTEVIDNKDGYTKVKIAEPKTWRYKHLLVWEEHNGPLPKGKIVIFGDGNKGNFDPANLIAIERRELAYLNRNKLIKPDVELTKTAVNIAKVAAKVSELKRKQR